MYEFFFLPFLIQEFEQRYQWLRERWEYESVSIQIGIMSDRALSLPGNEFGEFAWNPCNCNNNIMHGLYDEQTYRQRISFDISQLHTRASQHNMLSNGPGRSQYASSTPAYTLFLNWLLIWLAGRLVYQFR